LMLQQWQCAKMDFLCHRLLALIIEWFVF
jgi:hypothetical protein